MGCYGSPEVPRARRAWDVLGSRAGFSAEGRRKEGSALMPWCGLAAGTAVAGAPTGTAVRTTLALRYSVTVR